MANPNVNTNIILTMIIPIVKLASLFLLSFNTTVESIESCTLSLSCSMYDGSSIGCYDLSAGFFIVTMDLQFYASQTY